MFFLMIALIGLLIFSVLFHVEISKDIYVWVVLLIGLEADIAFITTDIEDNILKAIRKLLWVCEHD